MTTRNIHPILRKTWKKTMLDMTGRMMNKSPPDNCLPPPIFTLLSAVLTHVHTALINFPSLEYGTHERKQIIQLCVYDVVNGTGDEHMWTLSGEGGGMGYRDQKATMHSSCNILYSEHTHTQTQPTNYICTDSISNIHNQPTTGP